MDEPTNTDYCAPQLSKVLCLAACWLILSVASNPVTASGLKKTGTSNSAFIGARNEMRWLFPVKIQHMTDEQLIYAAEQLVNNTMSANQRILNHYWLSQDTRRTYHGGRAVGKLLRIGWNHYRENTRALAYATRNEEEPSWFLETGAFLTRWGDYNLRVSNDKMVLKLQSHF